MLMFKLISDLRQQHTSGWGRLFLIQFTAGAVTGARMQLPGSVVCKIRHSDPASSCFNSVKVRP